MRYWYIFLLCFGFNSVFSQQTVGLFYNDSLSYNGYTLFCPSAYETSYLIDNCGEVVNTWVSAYQPGLTGYLLPNGNLLRAARTNTNIDFRVGGAAGRVELFDWDGNLIWYFDYNDSIKCTNHDVQALPNGNVLLLVFYDITGDSAIALGRNPATVDSSFWECRIIEVQPTGMGTGNIVWEWHSSDHSVQDFDSTKANYGAIGANPRKFNINYPNAIDVDWMHVNGIEYNQALDQILLSSHRFCEVWIIDHSTTTAEAAGSTGGNAGHGGDLLYRWGNPAAYRRGTPADQVFFEQHDARWVTDGYPNAGKITVYNNGQGRPDGEYSTVDMFLPPLLPDGNYTLQPGQPFGPDSLFYRYTADPPLSFYSRNISGAQVQPNGNILVCEGAEGRLFEIGPNDSIVWLYEVPVNGVGPIAQGFQPVSNNTFQANRYGYDYPAFVGKDLTPQGPIELNPLPSNCQIYVKDTTVGVIETGSRLVFSPTVYPNPTNGSLIVTLPKAANITITSLSGAVVSKRELLMGENAIDISDFASGIYLYQVVTMDGEFVGGKLIME